MSQQRRLKRAKKKRIGSSGPSTATADDRLLYSQSLFPELHTFVKRLVNDGYDLDQYVIVATDPRRRDIQKFAVQAATTALLELAEDKATAVVWPITTEEARRFFRAHSPEGETILDMPRPEGAFRFIVLYENRIQAGVVRPPEFFSD